MDDAARESELSARVAKQLVESWARYWPFAASENDREREESRRRARLHYALSGEVLYEAPSPTGWADLRLAVAAVVLAMFGDGYFLLSAHWPRGVPHGALPERFSAANSIGAGTIDTWCRDHGHDLDLAMPDAGRWTLPISPSGKDQYQALADVGLAPDARVLRAGERPNADGHSAVALDERSRLRFWVNEYRSAFIAFNGRGAKTAFDGTSWNQMANELAKSRSTLPTRQAGGAEAEAVIAAGFTTQLVRGAFLMATSTPAESHADLHLMTPNLMESQLDDLGLSAWLATEPNYN